MKIVSITSVVLALGSDRDLYTLRKVPGIVAQGNPTAGSILKHVGFKVRDRKDVLDKAAARHFTIQLKNPPDLWAARIALTERSAAPKPERQ